MCNVQHQYDYETNKYTNKEASSTCNTIISTIHCQGGNMEGSLSFRGKLMKMQGDRQGLYPSGGN